MPMPQTFDYFDDTLLIWIEVPEGWEGIRTDDFALNLLGPEEDGYMAHVSLKVDRLVPPTIDRLDELVRETYHSGHIGLGQYRLIQSGITEIDGHPARVVKYEWRSEELGLSLVQLDALVLVNESVLYIIHGYSLEKSADKYLPLIAHIIGSIRFVPANSLGDAL